METPVSRIMQAVLEYNLKFEKQPQDIYVNKEIFDSLCAYPVKLTRFGFQFLGFNIWPVFDAVQPIRCK